MNWYVTSPASPNSYAQKRVYSGPMSKDDAEQEASERGERYSATRHGVLRLMKLEDNRNDPVWGERGKASV